MNDGGFSFTGLIPQFYDKGLGPILFEPYAIEVAQRVAKLSPSSVLEVACGTGRVTRRLREALGSEVRLVATDLSESMLAYAQAQDTLNVQWKTADAQALPFSDGEFDVVVCQFGMMMFPDRELAASEISRVLAAGGTAIILVWDEMAMISPIQVNHDLLREEFPDSQMEFLQVPVAMADPKLTEKILRSAFSYVHIERIEKVVSIEDPAAAASGLVQGSPVITQILEQDPTAPPRLIASLTRRLSDDPVARLSAWFATAKGKA